MRRNGNIRGVANHFVCLENNEQYGASQRTLRVSTHNVRFSILVLLWEIQWDGEHVNIGKRPRQPTTPIFKVGPIYAPGIITLTNSRENKKKRTVAIETDTDLRGDVGE
jgi:hypothetical protein